MQTLRDIFHNFSRVQIFNTSLSYLKLQRPFETRHFKNYAEKARQLVFFLYLVRKFSFFFIVSGSFHRIFISCSSQIFFYH